MNNISEDQTLKMDPKFKVKGILVIVSVFFGFMFAAIMTNDSINILVTVLPDLRDWSITSITFPITVGGWLALIATVVAGTIINKIGSVNCFKIGFLLMAIGVLIIGVVPIYGVYFLAIILTRIGQAFAFFASIKLTTDWFYKYRGRALGIVTIGCPLSSAMLVPAFMWLAINLNFGIAWIILGCLGFGMLILLSFLQKPTPEDYGWQQDGLNRSEEVRSKMGMTDDTPNIWKLNQMTKKKEYWILTISGALGGMVFGTGLMLFIPVVTSAGIPLTTAVLIYSIGAFLAIPMSYISGIIDDKLGTKKAYLFVLSFTIMMPLFFVLLLTTRIALFAYLAAFCVGVLAGCLLNLNPSIKTWAFGRKAFVDFNRTAQAVENACVPFGVTFLALVYDMTGSYVIGYFTCLIVMAVVFVAAIFLKSHAPEVIGLAAAKKSAGANELTSGTIESTVV